MTKIYTHPNLYQVVNIQNLLDLKRIRTSVRNEFASGGSGELAPQDVWPELWLEDERDLGLAQNILAEIAANEQDDWYCGQCGESNAGSFDFCWDCEAPRKKI